MAGEEPLDTVKIFDFAIIAIFASLVFDISTQFGEQRQTLRTSDFWTKNEQRLSEGLNGMQRASLQAIALSLIIIIFSAIGISLPSRALNERMTWLLEGLSFLFAAVVLGRLSFQVAIWTGLYPKACVPAGGKEMSRTLKEVKFKIRWSNYRIFTRYFFFLMPSYQGVNAITIPVSMIVGIGVGLLVDYFVYLARRTRRQLARNIVVVVVAIMIFASSMFLADGVWFVVKVWEEADNPQKDAGFLAAFIVCLFIELILHINRWLISRKQDGKEKGTSESPAEAPDLEAEENEQARSELHQHYDDDDKEEEVYESPSNKLCSYWTCCRCVQDDDQTRSEKMWSFLSWIVWLVLVVFSLWLVIVNIGAIAQQEAVSREKLSFVHEAIYEDIDEGPVCAFDNKGADSNITTFENKEAAHAANFSVLHCGECGFCSDWHNLRLEYTTREYLESEAARCGRRSLVGGRQAVLECLESPRIGFRGQCAQCWTDDILCTKEFCAFIFIQSAMTNSVNNFQVSADTITSAACEEAHCEAGNPGDFVHCSGATRRRMNVTSTINRPGTQRCGIVDVDWSELFPE